jgi:hypothetical protein
MSLLHSLRTVFQRAPKIGARKDLPMPDPTPQSPDVTAHLTALADAVRQLAESQKTLVESLKAPPAAPAPTSADVSGDPTGGATPGALAAIDYSRLSPLQQITLGLRDARPAAPRAGAD